MIKDRNNRLAILGLASLLTGVSFSGCVSDHGHKQIHRSGYFEENGKLYFQDGEKRYLILREPNREEAIIELKFNGKDYVIDLGNGLKDNIIK